MPDNLLRGHGPCCIKLKKKPYNQSIFRAGIQVYSMETKSLISTVELLKASQDLNDVMDVMKSSFAELGFPEWSFLHQIMQSYCTSDVFIFLNFPLAWVERYIEMDYFEIDLTGRYYKDNNLPWIWNVNDDWSGLGGNVTEFMEDVRRHGFAGGLCIPIFSAQNTRGFITLTNRDPSLENLHDALNGRAAQIVFLLRFVQEEIIRIAKLSDDKIFQNPLTVRQQEVLLWVGEGLTAKDIASKLGISFRTVEHYLAEIQQKLGVANRQQAVTRAVSLGYFQPLNLYRTSRDPAIRIVLPWREV